MTSPDVDAAASFAATAAAVRERGVPPDVADATATFVLDTLAVGLAGSSAAGVQAGLDLYREAGGAAQASLLVYGDRLPAPAAALLNATMCQARDFDAVYEPGVLLPYAPVTAAALAAAELVGASGAEALAAVAVGADLTCRLGRSLRTGLAWSRTATAGTFGAAIAAAYVLRLDPPTMVSALGLALSQSSGTIQTVVDGALAKRYQAGFAAQAGVLSALLAARGVTGPEHPFEGRFGFFNLYEHGEYDRALLLEGLGERFEGVYASVKPYPCAREQHGAIAATLRLCDDGLRADDVDSVTVALPPNAYALSSGAPAPGRAWTVAQAMGSAVFGVATAMARRRVSLDDFSAAALRDDRLRDLANRITVVRDDGVTDPTTLVPQRVTALLRDGSTRTATVDVMPGSPECPLRRDELEAKLAACAAATADRLEARQVRQLSGRVLALGELTGVRGVLDATRPCAAGARSPDHRGE